MTWSTAVSIGLVSVAHFRAAPDAYHALMESQIRSGRVAVALVLAAVLGLFSALPATAATRTLVGAGDIAYCSGDADAATAKLVASIPGTVFTAGDNVYPDGSRANFLNCYKPTWGAFKKRTRPTIGNHEYYNHPNAHPYFRYFGRKAGPSGRGYYKYTVGAWRIYSLTSECKKSSICYAEQLAWLKKDLETNPYQCVAAIWHRPLFSTGPHGSSSRTKALFQMLYDHGAELVINGHDHMYERYTPIDADGTPDPDNGLREFVVGTGGASLYGFKTDSPLIDVRDNTSHGVLRLDLSPGSYSWQFVPVEGDTFTDSGNASCH
jgi:3',5'-cyclic AMP phosphodiesterase CpdA